MENTLGQIIGMVEDNFKVTNNAGVETQLRVKLDFSSCLDSDIKSWLCGNRRIALQRPMRSLTTDEIKALDGTVINALECGRKVKSREEKIADLKSAFIAGGVNEEQASQLAIAAVDNPQLLTVSNNDVE